MTITILHLLDTWDGNPLPGTIIKHKITHPFHFGFYLRSHVAIRNTASVHYHVIHEVQRPVNKLQAMVYQQYYQHTHSTTSTSIHPDRQDHDPHHTHGLIIAEGRQTQWIGHLIIAS